MTLAIAQTILLLLAGAALFRLYRATVSEHWVLIPGRDPDRGSGVDRSERVSLD